MTDREKLRIAVARVEALEALLVCYRIGKYPTEKLHVQLEKSKKSYDRMKEDAG